jgi:predicted PilT family ATPase
MTWRPRGISWSMLARPMVLVRALVVGASVYLLLVFLEKLMRVVKSMQ